MSDNQEPVQVTYSLAFNSPPSLVSFHAFGGNPTVNRNLGVRYRVCARNEEERELRFYTENEQPLPYEELSELIRRKKAEGMPLTGAYFIVEVYDRSGNRQIAQQADTTSGWPSEATGDTVVYAKYHR